MRSRIILITVIGAIAFMMVALSSVWAGDYEQRFVRNYPPGYYGMWYYAERFFDTHRDGKSREEDYRWDKYMSKGLGLHYPFLPVPQAWDYGSQRDFNLPDYSRNDWP